MTIEVVHPLDSEALELFASKGQQPGTALAQAGNANCVKVRRVIQILRDLAEPAGDKLRILDLACGEGVYAIEAALRGAEVLALDARTERMGEGARTARRLGLVNLRFEQSDVRAVNVASHGQFDVIFFLGILYHLDVPDVFRVLENVRAMCRQMVIIDTHVCLTPRTRVEHDGRVYEGCEYREHGEHDPDAVRRSRLLASLDNTVSFWFTKKSLVDLLRATGFTSVLECYVPLEPLKPQDRVTLVAMKGTRVRISTYPLINDKTEDEVERTLRAVHRSGSSQTRTHHVSTKGWIRDVVNRLLRPLGCQIIRV